MGELYTNATQKSDYTKIPNKEILNNVELTWQAKGLWAYIASKPEGWKFSIDRMARQCKSGYTATKNALDELIEYKLVIRAVKNTKCGKDVQYGIYKTPIVESPTVETHVGETHAGKSPAGETAVVSNTGFSKTDSSKTDGREIGDSNESDVPNNGNVNVEENLRSPLNETESFAELPSHLTGIKEGEVVNVPPAEDVGNSPAEKHSLERSESDSKAGVGSKTNKDKVEQEKPRKTAKKRSVFVPPSIEEIQAYCNERKNRIDAEAFWAYYESNGWYVGKNKMKSWKAAVITWEKKDKEWRNDNRGNQNTGLARGDVMYEPKPGEDMTYQRMFEKWKTYMRVSVPQTNSQVEACKGLLADIGEEGVERLIIALVMRAKHSYLPGELTKIKDFVGLRQNAMIVQNFYDKNWEYWQRLQEAKKNGKEIWVI